MVLFDFVNCYRKLNLNINAFSQTEKKTKLFFVLNQFIGIEHI